MQVVLIFKNKVCKLKEPCLVFIIQEQRNVYECKNIGEQKCINLIYLWSIDFWQMFQDQSML